MCPHSSSSSCVFAHLLVQPIICPPLLSRLTILSYYNSVCFLCPACRGGYNRVHHTLVSSETSVSGETLTRYRHQTQDINCSSKPAGQSIVGYHGNSVDLIVCWGSTPFTDDVTLSVTSEAERASQLL